MRPRIRTIKPEFFGDERICAMTVPARLLAAGLVSAADDRGRLEHSIAAIRGHVFPRDGFTDRKVTGWLQETIGDFALTYEAGGWPYLWLPNFWRHQVINRPTESLLPAHPEDPYADLPIGEALKKFREDSLINHGGLTPSRVGGRSSSISSSSSSSTEDDKGNSNSARKPSKPVDQDALPSSLPESLHDTARQIHPLVVALYDERGGDLPTLRGVGLAIEAFPDRDHIDVARQLQHWALAGKGRNQTVVDWARTYRTFLRKAVPAKATQDTNGKGQSEIDARRLASMHKLMNERGAA